MAGAVTLKRHDTFPVIQRTLEDSDGNPIDLTGATVTFIMTDQSSGAIVVNAAATIVDATNGIVEYDWIATNTTTAGTYNAEFQVVYPGGGKQTFPQGDYITITIVADLDNA